MKKIIKAIRNAFYKLLEFDGILFECHQKIDAPYDLRKLHEVCINPIAFGTLFALVSNYLNLLKKMGSSLCLTLDDTREELNIAFVLSKESFEA